MAKLSQHQSSKIAKILYIGDSGTGKTGSLVSLVSAGYKLYILDTDNGVDVLKAFVRHQCPDKIDNIDTESRRDIRVNVGGEMKIKGQPKAYIDSLALLTKWSDGAILSELGENHILVIDSFSGLSNAALEWARGLNPGAKDPRQWYFTAQQSLEKVIDLITSANFNCNVIVISHIDYKEREDGTQKGYARAVGSALGPIIPRYFNTMVLAETIGAGKSALRKIKTLPTGIVDLKTPVPFKLDKDLDLPTGMATIFEKLKE